MRRSDFVRESSDDPGGTGGSAGEDIIRQRYGEYDSDTSGYIASLRAQHEAEAEAARRKAESDAVGGFGLDGGKYGNDWYRNADGKWEQYKQGDRLPGQHYLGDTGVYNLDRPYVPSWDEFGTNQNPPTGGDEENKPWMDWMNEYGAGAPDLAGIAFPPLGLLNQLAKLVAKGHDYYVNHWGNNSDTSGDGKYDDLFDTSSSGSGNHMFNMDNPGYVPPEYRDRQAMEDERDPIGAIIRKHNAENAGNTGNSLEPGKDDPGGSGGTGGSFLGPTGAYDYGYSPGSISLTGPQANAGGSGGFDLNALIQNLMQQQGGR